MSAGIASAVAEVRGRVADAAARAGRDPEDVTIVAVSKGVAVDAVAEAAACGLTDFGENRSVELRDKALALADPRVRWHFLGEIQTNKVKHLDAAALIHGLDRLREGEALQARGERCSRGYDVLVEVNVAEEASKQGVDAAEAQELLAGLAGLTRVRTRGLMFVAPRVENAEDVRALFARARSLRDRLSDFGLVELSMGMSDDFAVAVEEGSTIVRIGRAIFGERPAPAAQEVR